MMTKPTVYLYYEIVFVLATTPAYKKKTRVCGIGVGTKGELASLARAIESYT
jgi:hypothetical protein